MKDHQRNIIVLSTTIFLAAFSWNQIVPLLPLFLKQIGAGKHTVQWSYGIFVAQALAGILAQPLWGKVADSVGRKPMIIRAGVFLTAIYAGMSFCQAPWQVAVFRFLNGALTGFIPGSFALIATNSPQQLAPRYIATAQTASASGLILGPAIGWALADAVGFRWSMRISGLAVLISTLAVLVFVKEEYSGDGVERTSILQDLKTAMRSRPLVSVLFASMIACMFGSAINPVLALHLGTLKGWAPKWLPGAVFSLPAVAMVLSARRWSRIGESWGYPRILTLGMLGGGLVAAALAFIYGIWTFAAVYFFAGLMMSAISPATGAIICLRVAEDFRGRAYGMQTATVNIGALIAFLGAMYAGTALGIRGVFAAFGIVLALGAVGYHMLAREPQRPAGEELGASKCQPHETSTR